MSTPKSRRVVGDPSDQQIPCESSTAISHQASQFSEKDRKRLQAEDRQRLYKKLLPDKQQLEKLEKEISRTESRKLEIEVMMAGPDFYKDGDEAKKISLEYRELQTKLEVVYYSWNEVTEKIANVEKNNK